MCLSVPCQVFKPYMDGSLSRQFLRLKRSGVKPHTWLGNHMDMLSLLVPSRDLERVLQANGEWEGVADSIKNLMDSSAVGKTVFSLCSQLVNASHYKMLLERMLAEVEAAEFDEQVLAKFKEDAQKAADSFKALGWGAHTEKAYYPCFLLWFTLRHTCFEIWFI